MGIRDSFGAAGKGSYSKYKIHNFDSKQAVSVLGPFRFMPPMGELKDDPRGWRVYHGVHYGYKGVAFGSDKTKTKHRVFACIEQSDFRTKMITVSCPECRLIEQKERQLQDIKDDIKMNLKAAGLFDDKQLEAAVEAKVKVHEQGKPILEWLSAHNRDGKYYVNLVDAEMAPGLVKLAKRHIDAIEEAVDQLAKVGVAALNDFDQGAWFTLTRKGSGNDTKHLCNWVAEEVPGVPGATKPKLAPLTDAVLENCAACLPNLKIPPMASLLNADQIALLTECSGDPDEVDAIFKMTERSPSGDGGTTTGASQQQTQRLPPASTAPASQAKAAAPAGNPDPRYAKLKEMGLTEAQIEGIIGKPVTKPAPPPVDPRIAQMKAMGFDDAQISAALAAAPAKSVETRKAPQLTDEEKAAIASLESGNNTTVLPAGSSLISLAAKAAAVKREEAAEGANVAADASGLDPNMDTAAFAEEFALPAR